MHARVSVSASVPCMMRSADGSSAAHELTHAWALCSFVTARVEGMDGGEKKQSQVRHPTRPMASVAKASQGQYGGNRGLVPVAGLTFVGQAPVQGRRR